MRLNGVQLRDLETILAMALRVGGPALVVAVNRFRAGLLTPKDNVHRGGAQLWLWEEDGQPWRGRLGPDAPIRCKHFEATIPLKTCLQRQDAVWPGKRAGIHTYCASGDCLEGAANKLRAAYSATADWARRSKNGKPSYQFYRKDAGAQQARRRIYLQSQPDLQCHEDLPPERPGPDLEDEDVQQLLHGGG